VNGKVVHVCPTYFSPDSVIAGAELYSYNLARAMSRLAETLLVTFGPDDFVRIDDGLTVKCYRRLFYIDGNRANPFALTYLKDLLRAQVIDCHQFTTVTTDLAILLGLLSRKRVFVTDLGGGTGRSLSCHLPLWKGIRSLLVISEYNRNLHRGLPVPARVIYGGVDAERFSPELQAKRSRGCFMSGGFSPSKAFTTSSKRCQRASAWMSSVRHATRITFASWSSWHAGRTSYFSSTCWTIGW